jgi:hypothetical protein
VTSIFLITPFIMNSSQLSNEDSDIKFFKVFNKLKNAQHSKISHKELKKVKIPCCLTLLIHLRIN